MDVRENAIRSIAQADGDGLQPAARYVVDALDAARAEVAALKAENEQLRAELAIAALNGGVPPSLP